MKYTTKRSKVEEVVIDLEDGCVLKLNARNVRDISLNKVVNTVRVDAKNYPIEQYYEGYINLTNGISYDFETTDETLVENLRDLIAPCWKG